MVEEGDNSTVVNGKVHRFSRMQNLNISEILRCFFYVRAQTTRPSINKMHVIVSLPVNDKNLFLH